MHHIPVLRAGTPYRSLNLNTLDDFRTGETLAEISQANAGLIAHDLNKAHANQRALAEIPIPELVKMCAATAKIFLEDTLPLGEDGQSTDDYINQVSATTGMPKVMARKNMSKIATAMEKMEEVLHGLTRDEPLEELHLKFRRDADSLGAILPSNSPGVHSLWLPAIPMHVPLVLKPGSREPWSPYRIIQAFLKAGIPPQALSYYPTDRNGTAEVLLRCGKSMFFGDKSTVAAWKGEDRIQIHGPGWSKVLIGKDKAAEWEKYLDLMASSVTANGGRSCINASGVWVAENGRAVAEGLARKLAAIPARGIDDPRAQLSAMTNPKLATMISNKIDSEIAKGGAEDITAKYREGGRVAEVDGATFLLPTVVWCDDPDHPLARAEYMFPYCAVVETQNIPETIEATLVATVLSEDTELLDKLLSSHQIDRINVGPIPTMAIRWDQPHEGNLFELLYHQRAVQFEKFA